MANVKTGAYPPTEFSQKYAAVLAPKGKLVAPSDVFGENGVFGEDVEEKTRHAFKVTMKKLDKINSKSEMCKDDLARERIDQVFNVHSPLHIIIDLFYGILDTKLLIQYNYYVIKFCKVL